MLTSQGHCGKSCLARAASASTPPIPQSAIDTEQPKPPSNQSWCEGQQDALAPADRLFRSLGCDNTLFDIELQNIIEAIEGATQRNAPGEFDDLALGEMAPQPIE